MCLLLKKILAGFVSCLGIVSSVLALADAFPQYNNVFLVLIGVFVGFLLGALTPKDKEHSTPLDNRTKAFLLMVTMFLLPPLLLVGLIAAITALGFMTEALLGPILAWGFVGVMIAYITAGLVAYYIAPPSTNVKQDKQHDQEPTSE